jgi:hypothetical protein
MSRPAPVTAAAILLIVAAVTLQLSTIAAAFDLLGCFCLLSLISIPPCYLVTTRGVRLLQSSCPSASQWGWWFGIVSVPSALVLIPCECVLLSLHFDPNIRLFQELIRKLLAFCTAALGSMMLVVYASILLVQNADAYSEWREARQLREEKPDLRCLDE